MPCAETLKGAGLLDNGGDAIGGCVASSDEGKPTKSGRGESGASCAKLLDAAVNASDTRR